MPSRRLRTVARASRTRKEAVLRLEIKTLMCLTSPWIHADRAFVWRRQQPRPYRAVSNEELPARSSGTRLKTYLLPSPADACNAVSFRPWSIWRAAINCYLGEHCRKARPLVWTAYPDRNIGKVNRGSQAMASHQPFVRTPRKYIPAERQIRSFLCIIFAKQSQFSPAPIDRHR